MDSSRFFNGVTLISRMFVGALFVVSGLIKSNDALGFMYKLEEYFEPGALNLEAWIPYALEIAVFVCIAEVLLGIALLVGALPKLTSLLTLVMMLFFTWLTWYTATCDPFGTKMITDALGANIEIANQCVLECGCFGNAIPLTAYQSFLKDLFLLIFVVPITIAAFRNKIELNDSRTSVIIYTGAILMTFLFCYWMLDWNFPILYLVLLLFAASAVRRRIDHPKVEWMMAIAVMIVAGLIQYKTLTHLPLKDYRAYAVGENIIENRMSAEELGLEAPTYATEYTFKNTKTGVDTIVLSSDYLKIYNESRFSSTYEIVTYDGREVKVSEGYEPRIMDLIMENADGDDLTDAVLSKKGYTFFHLSKDLEAAVDAGAPAQEAFNALASEALEAGVDFYGLTNAGTEYSSAFSEDFSAPYRFLSCDQIELKIMIRSNPGLVLMKDGVIVEKWSWRDVPAFSDLELQ
ncbi:MAG: DoxX family protein [Flavobacteriales bacterium]|nr:DoxX family protein [Flavobacteriales bacterium]